MLMLEVEYVHACIKAGVCSFQAHVCTCFVYACMLRLSSMYLAQLLPQWLSEFHYCCLQEWIKCWPSHTSPRNVKTQTQLFSGLVVLHWQFIDEQLFSMAKRTCRFLSAALPIWDTELSQGTEASAERYQVAWMPAGDWLWARAVTEWRLPEWMLNMCKHLCKLARMCLYELAM